MKRVSMDQLVASSVNFRRSFDQSELEHLANAMQQSNYVEPILVRRNGTQLEVVKGERRRRSAVIAGLTEVPVVIEEFGERNQSHLEHVEPEHRARFDAMLVNFMANRHRLRLKPLEYAEAVLFLCSYTLQIDEKTCITLLQRMKYRSKRIHDAKKKSGNMGVPTFRSHESDRLVEDLAPRLERFFESVIKCTWLSYVNHYLTFFTLSADIRDAMMAGLSKKAARLLGQVSRDRHRSAMLELVLAGLIKESALVELVRIDDEKRLDVILRQITDGSLRGQALHEALRVTAPTRPGQAHRDMASLAKQLKTHPNLADDQEINGLLLKLRTRITALLPT
jgi:ParB-like nuclease domain